jgi:hypothetical protein
MFLLMGIVEALVEEKKRRAERRQVYIPIQTTQSHTRPCNVMSSI